MSCSLTTHSAHIFLLKAVMSREALMIRSLRSWCSSSSLRKTSNMGMNGDATLLSLGLPSWKRFTPAILLLESAILSKKTVPMRGVDKVQYQGTKAR